jgi:hypothetical protein
LLPFAAHSHTALAMVSQLAQEAGFPATTSLKTLATQLGVTGAKAKGELVKGVEQAIIKMSNLNQVARNLSAVVATQLDGAMAGAIVKASGLDQAYTRWANDVKSNAGPKTLAKDLQTIQQAQNWVNTALHKGASVLNGYGKAAADTATHVSKAADATNRHILALTKQESGAGRASAALAAQAGAADKGIAPTGNLANKTNDLGAKASAMGGHVATAGSHISTAGSQAGTAAGRMTQLSTSQQRVDSTARTGASAVNALHTAIGNASSAAAGATGRMFQLSVSEGRVGTSAFQAAAAVRQLASAIASLQSKTITVTTVMNTVRHGAAGGVVGVSMQHGGVLPGYAPGRDTVPAMLSPGEGILTPQAVRMLGADWVHAVNSLSGHGTFNPAALRSGRSGPVSGGGHEHPIVINLDSREIFNSMKQQASYYGTRNSGRRTGIWQPT